MNYNFEELRIIREEFKVSIDDVANAIEVPSIAYALMETGEKPLTPIYIDRLCKYYGISEKTFIKRISTQSINAALSDVEEYFDKNVANES